MKRIVFLVILFILIAGAADLMKQKGWISQEPMWLFLGLAAAFGVILGRWLRNGKQ
jgi:uncharacterized membrane protein